MATPLRKRSATGFYHVVQRGVNRFDIFEDNDDRICYLDILKKVSKKYTIKVIVWCLMSNHTHLLLKGEHENLVCMMRDLGSMYAKYFNKRHGRSGPLFEGRFKSVCIETDAQLIAVARYIHRNPIAHEEATLFGNYAWSSYKEYLGNEKGICAKELLMSLFGSLSEFVRIHNETWPFERHLDIGVSGRMSDEEARNMANIVLEGAGISARVSEIGALPHDLRDEALALVKHLVGCPLRQLQRLTAVSYLTIRKAVMTANKGGALVRGQADSFNSAIAFVSQSGFSLLREARVGNGLGSSRCGMTGYPN